MSFNIFYYSSWGNISDLSNISSQKYIGLHYIWSHILFESCNFYVNEWNLCAMNIGKNKSWKIEQTGK